VSRDDGSRFTLSFQSAPALPFSLGWVAVGNLSGGVASPAVSIELSAGKRVLLSGHSAVVPPGADSVTVPLDIALADGGYAVVWSLAGPDAPAVQSVERTPSAFTLTFVAETTEPLVVWWQVHGELT
jgi:methionine-rich copper-binding protein CopC